MEGKTVKGSEVPSLMLTQKNNRVLAHTEPSSTNVILACLLLITGFVKLAYAAAS